MLLLESQNVLKYIQKYNCIFHSHLFTIAENNLSLFKTKGQTNEGARGS